MRIIIPDWREGIQLENVGAVGMEQYDIDCKSNIYFMYEELNDL